MPCTSRNVSTAGAVSSAPSGRNTNVHAALANVATTGCKPPLGHHAQTGAYAHHAQHQQRCRGVNAAVESIAAQHDTAHQTAERGQTRSSSHQGRRHRQSERHVPAKNGSLCQHRTQHESLYACNEASANAPVSIIRQPMLLHARSAPVSTRTVLPFVYPFRYASLAVFPVYSNVGDAAWREITAGIAF